MEDTSIKVNETLTPLSCNAEIVSLSDGRIALVVDPVGFKRDHGFSDVHHYLSRNMMREIDRFDLYSEIKKTIERVLLETKLNFVNTLTVPTVQKIVEFAHGMIESSMTPFRNRLRYDFGGDLRTVVKMEDLGSSPRYLVCEVTVIESYGPARKLSRVVHFDSPFSPPKTKEKLPDIDWDLDIRGPEWESKTFGVIAKELDQNIHEHLLKDASRSNACVAAAPPVDIRKERRSQGLCPDCGTKGEWKSMACVCPEHGTFIG